jgi:alkylation response protein AidB-like acyl-CoA dehydrogenase
VRKKARAGRLLHAEHAEEPAAPGLSMLGRWRSRRNPARRPTGLASPSSTAARPSSGRSSPRAARPLGRPDPAGEYREAWAVTEPGAGSDVSAVAATAVRDGDEWVLNGEKWFVTSEGDPGFYIVSRSSTASRCSSSSSRHSRPRAHARPWLPARPVPRPPPELVLRDCRVPDENRGARGRQRGRKGVVPRRAPLHRSPLLRRFGARARASRATGRSSASPSGSRSPSTRASPSSSPTPGRPLAARLLTYHAAHAFDAYEDRKVVHGKWPRPKLFASEAAGASSTARSDPRRPRLHDREPVARFWREVGSTGSGRGRARSSASSSPVAS